MYYLFDKYTFVEKIGSGGFGNVYKIMDKNTSDIKALKVSSNIKLTSKNKLVYTKDKNNSGEKVLLNEMDFYKNAHDVKGIVNTKYVRDEEHQINGLIMDCLGDSFDYINIKKDTKKLAHIAIETLGILKEVHNMGYIHRDIKPSNFAFEIDSDKDFYERKIYCIDFGLCKKYVNTGEKIDKFIGTRKYASISAHKKLEQSRKDDLESLGYLFVQLYHRKLPWDIKNSKDSKYTKNKKIKKIKQKIPDEKICKNMPNEFCIYLKYVKYMDLLEPPPYDSFINMFKKLLL